MGRPWGFISAPLGSIWVPLGSMLVSCGHQCGKGLKKVPKKHRIKEPGGQYFDDILSFCRKWQTAFGLRLRGRIRVGAPCFLCFRSATGLSTCSLMGRPSTAAGSTSPSASTRPRAVCSCFFSLCGTLRGLVVSLERFGWPFGSIVAPWASILTHMGYSWRLLGTLGRPWGFIWAPLGSIWVPLGSILVSCGHFGAWPWTPRATFMEKGSKKHEK